jgi:hypothetical protein
MNYLERHPKFRAFLVAFEGVLTRFAFHPFRSLWMALKDICRWFWHGLRWIGIHLWQWTARHKWWVLGTGIVLASLLVVAIGVYCGLAIYFERQMSPAPDPGQVVYLDQGWGTAPTSDDRLFYYYEPQGAFLFDIRYEWLANLERPWKRERFASPQYMRAYGFVVDTSQSDKNPGRLPVGFAPRYDPKYGEMMLDLTCSACHTGELEVVRNGVRTAVRVDGAPGHHDFTGTAPGHFAGDLAMSLLNTYVNPFKFRRFAAAILGDRNTRAARSTLSSELFDVLGVIIRQALTERKFHLYPVTEGYGRTDGLGRILNAAFAVNLDEKNYRVGNAPVSYPFIWEIPWFDWVQYTGSVRQPMARNIGEDMGTGARYFLKNPYGQPLPASERFDASIKIANLDSIENLIRKLRAPCWPEDVFGKIDRAKAARGKDLFENKFHCVSCHGPHIAPDIVTAAEAPLKLTSDNPNGTGGVPHWIIKALDVQDIGTDPTSALNFYRYRVDLTPTGMTADEARKELTPYYTNQYFRDLVYYQNLVTLLAPDNNGYLDKPSTAAAAHRTVFAQKTCHLEMVPLPEPPIEFRSTDAPVALHKLTKDQIDNMQITTWNGNKVPLTSDNACAALSHLMQTGMQGYLQENLGSVDLSKVTMGAGLNYLITLVRKRAYEDLGVTGDNRVAERNLLDGYAQLDTPYVAPQYQSRPLAGVWATAPFLHNGSVPSLYEMLLPAYRRSKKFYLKGDTFDPRAVGLVTDASQKGAFLFDTTLPGNSNQGHEFRAGYREWKEGDPPAYGLIGPEMTDDERWAIVEYLKIRRDIPDDPVCPEENYLTPPAAKEKKP